MFLSWDDLNSKEKEQVKKTYRAIMSISEETREEEIDISNVENCSFERDEYEDYVHVIV